MTIKEVLMDQAMEPHKIKENKKTTNAQSVCDFFGITPKEVIEYKKGKMHETI